MTDYRAKAERWLSEAELKAANFIREGHSGSQLEQISALATLASAYAQYATLQYIEERDNDPFDERKQLIEIGIELGKERSDATLRKGSSE